MCLSEIVKGSWEACPSGEPALVKNIPELSGTQARKALQDKLEATFAVSTHSPLGLTDSLDHKRRSRKEIRGNLLCETPAHSPLGMTDGHNHLCIPREKSEGTFYVELLPTHLPD